MGPTVKRVIFGAEKARLPRQAKSIAMNTVRIAIIEDDALLSSLLTDWIQQRPGWAMIGHAGNGTEGLKLCLELQPDLVLVDVSMPDMDGLTMVEQLKKHLPQVKSIVLTCHNDPFTIQRVLNLGIQGFVSKTSSLTVLDHAVRQVLAGATSYDETFLQSALPLRDPEAFHKILSRREIEVLSLVAEGQPDESIGQALGISAYTVAAHRRNIRVKLNAHNDRDLISYARHWGLTRRHVPGHESPSPTT